MLLVISGQGSAPPLPEQQRALYLFHIEQIIKFAQEAEMPMIVSCAERAHRVSLDALARRGMIHPKDYYNLISHAEQLLSSVYDHLQGITAYIVTKAEKALLEAANPFGEHVEDSFPSAMLDIQEASRCFGFRRWTACVMHTMRALEVALGALANHYGVKHNTNWNQTLNLIEAAVRDVKKSVHGAEAEQWAAEAATHFRFIKNAFRNHAMHPQSHYDEDRARGIFNSSRDFMQHLAKQMREE